MKNEQKIHRLMRVSSMKSHLHSFIGLYNGHVWAAPPTKLEDEAMKLVQKALYLLQDQTDLDREGVLPE